MWKQQQKDSVIIKLALLMAITTSPMVANLLISRPVQAENQSDTPAFSLPQQVDNGTVVKIDGSRNFISVNQSLKENFEKQFPGTQVEIAINGNEDAIKAVLDGKADLASLGRKLTSEEKAQGLEEVLVRREKIAIVVGTNNPFSDGITIEEFAKIFRGEITDWSEIGKVKGKIRFIDRPSISDTRTSFSEYPIFQPGELVTGANAVQMVEDNTANIIKELGNDGISYILANQVSNLQDVRVLKVQDYLPNNSKYPFSQSFVYVYKQNPSPKVRDFLGFILAKPGQESIESAKQAEALAIAASALQTFTLPSSTDTPTNTPTDTPTDTQNTSLPPITENLVTPQSTDNGGEIQLVNPLDNPSMITKNMRFFLLLPLFLIAGLSSFLPLWLRRKKQSQSLEKTQLPLNQESESISEAIPTISESELPTAIITNHHNGNGNGNGLNGANYYKEDNSQELTLINNIALIDIPEKTLPNDQVKEIPKPDLDYGEVVWDTEAPVQVVNSHYPQIPNIHHKPIDADISSDEFSNSLLEAPEPTKAVYPGKITSLSELLGIDPASVKEDSILSEVKEDTTLSELLGIDPASVKEDSILSEVKEDTNLSELLGIDPAPVGQQPQESDLPPELGEALKAIISENELKIRDIENEISPTPLHPTATDEAIAMELDAEIEAWTNINQINSGNTKITFTPRTPKWAYVSWYISDNHQQTLQSQGFTILAIRLYDVTNLDLSYQRPQLVQQYECETAIYDRYVPIPRGERDYMTEIGYLNHDNRWLYLARSGVVRIFSRPSADFWFVVDAELVIHGATEEGATVTIDGQKIKVNSDGTFKLTVPFIDNSVDYHLTATSANQEDSKTLDRKFFQEQKESN
jgi:phosphate transport system substrate-binding protein